MSHLPMTDRYFLGPWNQLRFGIEDCAHEKDRLGPGVACPAAVGLILYSVAAPPSWKKHGGWGGTRTPDTGLFRPLLYS